MGPGAAGRRGLAELAFGRGVVPCSGVAILAGGGVTRLVRLAVLATALLLVACGAQHPQIAQNHPGTHAATATPAPISQPTLTVDNSGYGGYVEPQDIGGEVFAEADALITNQSKAIMAEVVTVQATLTDASSGNVLGTGTQTIPFIHPGEQAFVNISPSGEHRPQPRCGHRKGPSAGGCH